MANAIRRARRTLVLPAEEAEAITRAAAILRSGGLVAFPTETVYGLGAVATSVAAVEGIFWAKQRPHSDPLIVHLAAAGELNRATRDLPPLASRLAEHFWPGPLTLVLPRAEAVPALVAAGGTTVGVRVPAHAAARALIAATGAPVAAPSANRFMHTSPTTAAHVLADLDGRIDCLLDGGPCAVGVESTVLDLTARPPRILRPGGVTLEALQTIAPEIEGSFEPPHADATPAEPDEPVTAKAPGQLARHYAPRTRLVVFDATGAQGLAAVRAEVEAARARGARVGVLLPDEPAADLEAALPGIVVARLGPSGDLAEHARRLYAALRELDDADLDVIVAHSFDCDGLGRALDDRLRRASGGTLRAV